MKRGVEWKFIIVYSNPINTSINSHYQKMVTLSMIWSGFVNWSRMYWLVNRFWAGSICSMSFVHNFRNVTRVVISSVICDNLGATIRKENTVLSWCGVAVTFFVLTKVYSTVFILYTIFVAIYRWSVSIDWSFSVCRSWMIWGWLTCSKSYS